MDWPVIQDKRLDRAASMLVRRHFEEWTLQIGVTTINTSTWGSCVVWGQVSLHSNHYKSSRYNYFLMVDKRSLESWDAGDGSGHDAYVAIVRKDWVPDWHPVFGYGEEYISGELDPIEGIRDHYIGWSYCPLWYLVEEYNIHCLGKARWIEYLRPPNVITYDRGEYEKYEWRGDVAEGHDRGVEPERPPESKPLDQ